MHKNLILFKEMPWENPQPGVLQKVIEHQNQRLRLLRFQDNFVEEHWCSKGHVGFVLDGEMCINFNGVMTNYKKGDGLWINAHENNRHKVLILPNKFVDLILFEPID